MIEINLNDIISYKQKKKSHSDYTYGGWYMILDKNNNNKKYVGKSIEYMFRLRQHLNVNNPKTLIDVIIKDKGVSNFSFYLLKSYKELNVNFFNRKIEYKVEKQLITSYKAFYPYGYNVRYYE